MTLKMVTSTVRIDDNTTYGHIQEMYIFIIIIFILTFLFRFSRTFLKEKQSAC